MDHLERCFGIFSFPRTLLKLPLSEEKPCVARRVDLIVTPASQWAYALVGWTGNKVHSLKAFRITEMNIYLKPAIETESFFYGFSILAIQSLLEILCLERITN